MSLATIHRHMAESSKRMLKGDDVASMHLRLAHTPVLIRAASSSLLWAITTSFRHLTELADDYRPAVLTIYVWDIGSASAVRGSASRRTSNRYFIYQCNDYDASLDLETGEMYCVVKRLTNTLVAYPFRRVLWRWLARQELFPYQGAVSRGAKARSCCVASAAQGDPQPHWSASKPVGIWLRTPNAVLVDLGTNSPFTACSAASSSSPSTPQISQLAQTLSTRLPTKGRAAR